MSGRASKSGFTLIELLVVVAIIALLISILVPSLAKAKLMAARTACSANMRNIGSGVAMYQSDYGPYVPMCWTDLEDPTYAHNFKSWRTLLLPYIGDCRLFNCSKAVRSGNIGELFLNADEVGAVNAGSMGVMYQWSSSNYKTANIHGDITTGHTMWTDAWRTDANTAWRNPFNSLYLADAFMTRGPVSYPSGPPRPGFGTSSIYPPGPSYLQGDNWVRRFADRHLGTNVLFVGGHVLSYRTQVLDAMVPGASDCIWDVQ